MSDLLQLIGEFKEVDLLALVTQSSAEVVFYCKINDKVYQSNNLVEEGLYDGDKMDEFYQKVTAAIRQSEKFRNDMLNIVNKVFDTDSFDRNDILQLIDKIEISAHIEHLKIKIHFKFKNM